jgi:hypothetical protein
MAANTRHINADSGATPVGARRSIACGRPVAAGKPSLPARPVSSPRAEVTS